tara:strand:+ start:1751 stop:2071 length:321 start_codon:yes stop_codon:yes gene_type:complete
MRANITYSVDMENIPQEVARITTSEAAGLSDHFYEIEAALRSKNFTEARNKIMSARQSLGNADIRLFELDQIMASYIEMINQGEEGEEEGPPEEEPPEELGDNEDG